MSTVHRGKPWPLGSTITKRGVNFCVAAPEATRLELLLFSDANKAEPEQIIHLNHKNQSGDYWHVEVEGLEIGCCYSYRVFKKTESKKPRGVGGGVGIPALGQFVPNKK